MKKKTRETNSSSFPPDCLVFLITVYKVWVLSPAPTKSSPTPAGCPAVSLNSHTFYLETASGFTG